MATGPGEHKLVTVAVMVPFAGIPKQSVASASSAPMSIGNTLASPSISVVMEGIFPAIALAAELGAR